MNRHVEPPPTVTSGGRIRHGRIVGVGATTVFVLLAGMMLMAGTVLAQEEDAPGRRSPRGGAEPGIDFIPNEKSGSEAAPRRRRSTTKSGNKSKGPAGQDTAKDTKTGEAKAERVRLFYVEQKKSLDTSAKDKTSDDCEVKGGLTPGIICVGEKIARGGGGGGGGGQTSGDAGAEEKLLKAHLNVFVAPELFSADDRTTYKITLDVGAPNMNVPRDLESRGQALSDIATVMRRLPDWQRTLNAKETKKLKLQRSFTFRLVKPFQGLKKMRLVEDPVRLTVRIPNVHLSDITSH